MKKNHRAAQHRTHTHTHTHTHTEQLHKFLDAAAGEGLVLDGVCAADLYIALFPEFYADAIAQPVQTTDAELLRNVTNVERRSDQSVTIVFTSCRAASEFERAAIAASKEGVQ